MRIDVHHHAFPPAALELLRSEPEFGASVTDERVAFNGSTLAIRPVSSSDPEAMLEQMAAVEIDGAVLSATPALLCSGLAPGPAEALSRTVNTGLAAMAAASPERLHWMAHVPLEHPELAVSVLEDAVRDGAVGVEVHPRIESRRIDAPEFEPFWAAAERLGQIVFPHPYDNVPHPALDRWHLDNVIGNLLETTVTAERLICGGVLDRYPQLRVLLAHAGGFFPYQAGRLRHARSVRRELVDTPVDPWPYCGQLLFDSITHDAPALAFLVGRVGVENVLLGTDLPAPMAPPQPVTEIREALGAEAAEVITQANPARLYGFA